MAQVLEGYGSSGGHSKCRRNCGLLSEQCPLHRQAEYLGGRDLFGDLCHAAHDDGLAVFARMDSNRAHEEFYHAHPDWFAIDREGNPYKAGDLFITCINSPLL